MNHGARRSLGNTTYQLLYKVRIIRFRTRLLVLAVVRVVQDGDVLLLEAAYRHDRIVVQGLVCCCRLKSGSLEAFVFHGVSREIVRDVLVRG